MALFLHAAAIAQSTDGAATQAGVTFARDIAPLLQGHCQDCHRPGQSTPMSLLTYAETRPWAKSIQQKVAAREMPPFHAAGKIGRYVGDPRLTDAEIASVSRWVESGAPEGDPADLPPPRSWNDAEWTGGEPDLVVTMPRYDIRSDGIDDNVDLYSDYVFPEDLWLRAVEVRPANRSALHHANVFLTFEDETIPPERYSREMKADLIDRPLLVQWLPGRSFETMPHGEAIVARAGRHIMVNSHYAPSTESQWDEMQIGLYFMNGTIDTVSEHIAINAFGFPRPIEPGETEYRLHFRREFDADVTVTAFHFHMHYRGSSARVTFRRPDGVAVAGIDVPRYDFNWQRKYTLSEPISLPKGTVANVRLLWDNSESNLRNPDPTQQVQFGLLTTDEMGAASIWYRDANSKLDPPVAVRDGRRVETP